MEGGRSRRPGSENLVLGSCVVYSIVTIEQVAVGPGFLQTHFLYHIYILATSST